MRIKGIVYVLRIESNHIEEEKTDRMIEVYSALPPRIITYICIFLKSIWRQFENRVEGHALSKSAIILQNLLNGLSFHIIS